MALIFFTSVGKRLEIKFKNLWGLIPKFVEIEFSIKKSKLIQKLVITYGSIYKRY